MACFGDAHQCLEHAKSYAANDSYHSGRATELGALFWYEQSNFKEAKSEALCAADAHERLGDTRDLEGCGVLRKIEEGMQLPLATEHR